MGAEPELVGPAAVVLVPFPAQGHVTPMLQLARALVARGVTATVAVPDFVHRRMGSVDFVGGVALASIPSGIPDDDDDDDEPPGFASIAHAMEHHMPAHLERMLMRGKGDGAASAAAACLIVDVLASWAVPVASRCGVPVVGFWPAMLATFGVVAAIPDLLSKGFISDCGSPISTEGFNKDEAKADLQIAKNLRVVPEDLQLGTKELLPWLVGCTASQKSRFAFWLQILQRAKSLGCLLVNSFPGEMASEGSERHGAPQDLQILQVGPLLTDGLLDIDNPHELPAENPSMWQADGSCMDWLDQQRPGSVIYVSFGSWIAPIAPAKISELAHGLEATGRPFLWVLKNDTSWRAGLPSGYLETVAGRGKVVSWAPQGGVLAHEAVGCYLTHCGWNSTLEAIQHGVRLLCYPVSGDQFINSAFIVKMWEIGIRLRSTGRTDVKDYIERIFEGEDGRRLERKMNELRERVAVGEARFVAKRNLQSFVDGIKRHDLALGHHAT